jgi:hypothetical protein
MKRGGNRVENSEEQIKTKIKKITVSNRIDNSKQEYRDDINFRQISFKMILSYGDIAPYINFAIGSC